MTSLKAPMRGNTVESFLMCVTNSLEIGELKKTNALDKNRSVNSEPQEKSGLLKDPARNIWDYKKQVTYFLYKGDFPDMSDKNATTLQKITK